MPELRRARAGEPMCRPDAAQIIAARAARAEQLEQTLRAGGRLVTYTLIRRQHAGLYLAAVPPKGMDSYMMERTGRWLPDVPVSPKALAEYVGCQARGAWDEGSRTEAISLPAPQPELYARTCSGAGVWGPWRGVGRLLRAALLLAGAEVSPAEAPPPPGGSSPCGGGFYPT